MICFRTIAKKNACYTMTVFRTIAKQIRCKSHPYQTISMQLLATKSKHDMSARLSPSCHGQQQQIKWLQCQKLMNKIITQHPAMKRRPYETKTKNPTISWLQLEMSKFTVRPGPNPLKHSVFKDGIVRPK